MAEQKGKTMKLLFAIIAKDDKAETEHALTSEGFMLTEMGTTGGFLKKKNVTLLIGTTEDKVKRAKEILKHTAGRRTISMSDSTNTVVNTGLAQRIESANRVPTESEIGGCTIFELNADKMTKY